MVFSRLRECETLGVPVSTILVETEGVTVTLPDAEVEMDGVLEAAKLEDNEGLSEVEEVDVPEALIVEVGVSSDVREVEAEILAVTDITFSIT